MTNQFEETNPHQPGKLPEWYYRIRELEEQIEDMKSCCICGKLNNCEVWKESATPPIHNVNDAPCDEWELG